MTKKILCATDGSRHSDPAVGSAADMSAKFGAKMTVIAVNTPIPEGRGASHPLWTEEQAEGILASAKQKAKAQASIDAETIKASGLDPLHHANTNAVLGRDLVDAVLALL